MDEIAVRIRNTLVRSSSYYLRESSVVVQFLRSVREAMGRDDLLPCHMRKYRLLLLFPQRGHNGGEASLTTEPVGAPKAC